MPDEKNEEFKEHQQNYLDRNEENIKENIRMDEDLNIIEKRINKLQEDCDQGEDQEEPMTLDRKIFMLSKIFPFAIGDRVRNKLSEDGIIDLVGLDNRGVIYLVRYKEGKVLWEHEGFIQKISSFSGSQDDSLNKKPSIKTDVNESDISGADKPFKEPTIDTGD